MTDGNDGNALKSQAKRLDVSWEIIEHEYRTGTKSIREIGREHNISGVAIGQKAKKLGWEREKDQETVIEAALVAEPDPKSITESGLGLNHKRFVAEYLIDGKAGAAYIRAGFPEKGARTEGPKLLRRPAIKAAIDRAAAEQIKRTLISADEVLVELRRIGFGDMGNYMTINPETGGIHLDFSAIEDGDGATSLIQEITQEEYVEGTGDAAERVKKTKIKLYSKLEALDKLMRHLSLYTEAVVKHEHTHEHHIIPAAEVRAEIEEWFRAPALLPPPLTPTEH